MPIKGNKIFFEFDPYELTKRAPAPGTVRMTKEEIAELVHEMILDYVGAGKSPVRNGKWKRQLSKDYKELKKEWSSSLFANMELKGDMLDNLEVLINPRGKIEVRQTGKQAAKADGHNNHSGKSKLPPREYIPKQNQTFKKPILDAMKVVIDGNNQDFSE